jgi:simple sugar transport system ATP-binding protein
MVHQHFKLVPALSVVENIILGLSTPHAPFLDLAWAEKKIMGISQKYGLKVDPKARIWQLSVGEQQRVEILKALYRGADVLILDEPTAVLTELEIRELMETLRKMASSGLAVVPFITHKLPEVMAVSHRVTILRHGKVVATLDTKNTNRTDLAEKMVGRKVLYRLQREDLKKGEVVLEVKDLETIDDKGLPAVNKISFSIHKGEIFGLAGVAGNGQRELVEAVAGLRKVEGGKVFLLGRDVTNHFPAEIIEAGVSYVPDDRMGVGLIMDFSIAENTVLKMHCKPPFAYDGRLPFNNNWFINQEEIGDYAEKLIKQFKVVAPDKNASARTLSGGNLQKLILSRELSGNLKVLIASNPTRGLDVGATEEVRRILLDLRAKGGAILLHSEDLDELMMVSDRLAVIYEGQIMGVVPTEEAKIEEIGLMMGGTARA